MRFAKLAHAERRASRRRRSHDGMKLLVFVKRIVPPMWFGIVAAIAAESWLKFQAPGITRELGLGIGKLIFTALNRTEIVLALLLAAAIFAARTTKTQRLIFIAIALILAAQTAWLLPQLI